MLAYVGPGLGAGAIAAVIGILAGFFLLILGFLWYPLQEAPSMDPQPEVTWMVLGLVSLPCALLTVFAVPRWKNHARLCWETAQQLLGDFSKARSDNERQALARDYGAKILGASFGLLISSSALLIALVLPWVAFAASNAQRVAWLTLLSTALVAGWLKASPPTNLRR